MKNINKHEVDVTFKMPAISMKHDSNSQDVTLRNEMLCEYLQSMTQLMHLSRRWFNLPPWGGTANELRLHQKRKWKDVGQI